MTGRTTLIQNFFFSSESTTDLDEILDLLKLFHASPILLNNLDHHYQHEVELLLVNTTVHTLDCPFIYSNLLLYITHKHSFCFINNYF